MKMVGFTTASAALAMVLTIQHTGMIQSGGGGGAPPLVAAAMALPAAGRAVSGSARCSELRRSMEARGATFDGADVRRVSATERAVVATRDLPAGHVVMRIPIDLALTPARAVEESKAAADASLAGARLGTTDSDLIAILLLSMRADDRDAEERDPFLDSLPTAEELSHLPVYWDDADRSLLDGCEVGFQLRRRLEREETYYTELSGLSESFAAVAPTLESWKWAKSNARARSFSIANPSIDDSVPGTCIGEEMPGSFDGTEGDADNNSPSPKVPAMIPLADMMNHAPGEDGHSCEFGMERESGDFIIRTVRDVSSESQLTLTYRPAASASVSLLNYGFISESNDGSSEEGLYDRTIMVLSLGKILHRQHSGPGMASNDEVLNMKEAIWERDEGDYSELGWKPMERQITLSIGSKKAMTSALSFLRVGVATKEELRSIVEFDEDVSGESIAAMIARDPVCLRNEKAALRALEEMLHAQLNSYAHFENDQNAETDPETEYPSCRGLTGNRRNACMVISAEKRVLHHWNAFARMTGQALEENQGSFDFGLSYQENLNSVLSARENFASSD